MASRSASHSPTLPSTSVNSNVTVPEGNPIRPLCTRPRLPERAEPTPVRSPLAASVPSTTRAGQPLQLRPALPGPGVTGRWAVHGAVRPTRGALDGAARPLPPESARAHAGSTAPPARRDRGTAANTSTAFYAESNI